jgi:hypothetical protein
MHDGVQVHTHKNRFTTSRNGGDLLEISAMKKEKDMAIAIDSLVERSILNTIVANVETSCRQWET